MRVLLLGIAVPLVLLAAVPAASAGPVSCGAATNLWGASYHCTAFSVGPAGTVNLCPDLVACDSSVYCAAEVSPLTVGCNFP